MTSHSQPQECIRAQSPPLMASLIDQPPQYVLCCVDATHGLQNLHGTGACGCAALSA